MKAVREAILNGVGNGTTFVFPSEIASEFWQRKVLTLGNSRAVRSDRFISWDTFKERHFNLNRAELPANGAIRTLYAIDFLNRVQEGDVTLSHIVPPAYAETVQGFARTIKGYLPRLNMIHELSERHTVAIEAELLSDIRKIKLDYEEFLSAHALFEPSWEEPGQVETHGPLTVAFPEVIEDFAAFSASLEGHVSLVHGAGESTPTVFYEFENSVAEASWIVRRIKTLIGEGVSPSEIAVTVTDTRDMLDILMTEAVTEGLPVKASRGLTLMDYPVSRMWRAIQQCADSHFSLSAMKSLLLDKSIPWQEPGRASALFRFGVDNRCYQNYPAGIAGPRPVQLWRQKLSGSELLSFFTLLEKAVLGMKGAETFEDLRNQVSRFTAMMLTIERAGGNGLRVYQRSADLLADLTVMERTIGVMQSVSPFETWLQIMDDQIYVEKTNTPGIGIYPYRVSAGISPQWHFIAGVSQSQTDVPVDVYPFLRDDHIAAMNLPDTSLTSEFLRVYAVSGENTVFSYGKQAVSGVQLPPGALLSWNVPVTRLKGEELGVSLCDDERLFWAGNGTPPSALPHLLEEGFSAMALTGFEELAGADDRTAGPIMNDELRDKVISAITGGADLAVSPTALDAFLGCPFSYLLRTGCRIEEEAYDLDNQDSRAAGSLEHDVLARLYGELIASSEPHTSKTMISRTEDVHRIAAEAMKTVSRRDGEFLPPVWHDFRRKLIEHILRFIEEDASEHPDTRILHVEAEFSGATATGTAIHGRIDRISSDNLGISIVDYKKRVWMEKSVMRPSEGALQSYQIPFYIILLEASGMDVSKASYYDVEVGGFSHVFSAHDDSGWWGREELEDAKKLTEAGIEHMSERMYRGDFSIADEGGQCDPCPLRSVCRQHYRVR